MTLTNYTSDGQFPVLIALVRVLAAQGALAKEDLIRVCSIDDRKHLKETLSTWTALGLFVENDDQSIRLSEGLARRRGEALEELTARIPGHCRRLIFDSNHALPLWRPDGKRTDGEVGGSADFVRELAWVLAQDIYSLTFDASAETAEALESQQAPPGRYVFINKTRWPGLCFWARYLGFAAADGHTIDPTGAIRDVLPEVFSRTKKLPAMEFVRKLNEVLPVLDAGRHRVEVEAILDDSVWRRPPTDHLSMSLSFALRRLQLERTIAFETQADTGKILFLSGRDFREMDRFSHVEWRGRAI